MNGIYPLVICYIAIENGPVEIVDLPIENGGSFYSYVSLPEGNMAPHYGDIWCDIWFLGLSEMSSKYLIWYWLRTGFPVHGSW